MGVGGQGGCRAPRRCCALFPRVTTFLGLLGAVLTADAANRGHGWCGHRTAVVRNSRARRCRLNLKNLSNVPNGSFPNIPYYAIGCTLDRIAAASDGRMTVERFGKSAQRTRQVPRRHQCARHEVAAPRLQELAEGPSLLARTILSAPRTSSPRSETT